MGRFFRGLLVTALTSLVALAMGAAMMAVLSASFGDVDIFMNILIFIPLIVLITWALSNLLGGLSHWDPIFYFIACAIIAVVGLVFGLNYNYPSGGGELDMLGSSIGFHMMFFSVWIPKINTETEDVVVKYVIEYDGMEFDIGEYKETRYLLGALVKLIIVVILGTLCGYLAMGASSAMCWVIFIIEIGLSIFKIIQNIVGNR